MIVDDEIPEAIASEIRAQLIAEIYADLQKLNIPQLVMISGFVRTSLKPAPNSKTT